MATKGAVLTGVCLIIGETLWLRRRSAFAVCTLALGTACRGGWAGWDGDDLTRMYELPEFWCLGCLLADVAMANKGRNVADACIVELTEDVTLLVQERVMSTPSVLQPYELWGLGLGVQSDIATSAPPGHSLSPEVRATDEELAHCLAVRDLEFVSRPRRLEGGTEELPDICEGDGFVSQFVGGKVARLVVGIAFTLYLSIVHLLPTRIVGENASGAGIDAEQFRMEASENRDAPEDVAKSLPIVIVVDRQGDRDTGAVPVEEAELAAHDENHNEDSALLDREDEFHVGDDLTLNFLAILRVAFEL